MWAFTTYNLNKKLNSFYSLYVWNILLRKYLQPKTQSQNRSAFPRKYFWNKLALGMHRSIFFQQRNGYGGRSIRARSCGAWHRLLCMQHRQTINPLTRLELILRENITDKNRKNYTKIRKTQTTQYRKLNGGRIRFRSPDDKGPILRPKETGLLDFSVSVSVSASRRS